MLQIGDLLDNKYRILSEVGRGGMSVVYLAINERANKTWAVKEFRKDGVMDFAAVRQGLMVEIEMLKRLHHPHLPSIVDVLDAEDSFQIVMDYIEDTSLLRLLRTEGAQPEDRVVKWGKQLCDVLGYLHRQKPPIIYRDMKPANVMLKPDGDITLINFGTAREFKDLDMVEDTICLGTRGYAAPEQFGGIGQTDARTDIYCLGATLYHLLTGHSPAEPPYEIKPISYWIPQYEGSGLEKLILKCTQPDPAERYQDCEELMFALEHYRDEDDRMLKIRKRQMGSFVASVVIGVLALCTMIFFRVALNGAETKSYESLIEQATMAESLEASQEFFLKALEVKAGDSEVYDALLSKVGTDITKEGKFTSNAARITHECLTKRPNGEKTNIEVLEDENPSEYANVMYDIGLWYFFLKDNSDEDRQTANNNYFSRIVSNETYLSYLDESQQGMAQVMSDIGSYIANLNTRLGRIGSGNESNYKTLFGDIADLASGDMREKVGTDYYAIAVYHQIAFWVDQKCSDFIGDGVTKRELNDLLATIRSGLDSLKLEQGNKNYAEYKAAYAAVDSAQGIVDRY